MKKCSLLIMALVLVFLLVACQTVTTVSTTAKDVIDQGGISVFPIQSDGFIGDPMPYFDGEKLNLFYLHDARDGNKGFHPWYLMQTSDFLSWSDQGEAIPYVSDYASQDLALGTGSVIQDANGLYHAYYTGFNGTGNVDFKEMIQHATSTDLIHWTKIPEDGFYGGVNDFRDPYVLYMEDEGMYWMLITSRVNNTGVIKLYKSSNLSDWTYSKVFFWNDAGTWNMECPTLIKYGDYWYLSYSEQGSNRIVHYRYTQDLSTGWTIPDQDYFDGIGFYAGRIEQAFGRLFAFGWVGTKEHDYDGGGFNWAGNLVTHELIQNPDGTLSPVPVQEVVDTLNHEVEYNTIAKTNSYDEIAKTLTFDIRNGYDSLIYDNLATNVTRLTFDVSIQSQSGSFGMTFYADEAVFGPVNIVFNVTDQALEFYNVTPSQMARSTPQISLPFTMTSGMAIHATVLLEDQCASIYVNDVLVLTTRMYFLEDYPFGFFGMKSDAVISNIHFWE